MPGSRWKTTDSTLPEEAIVSVLHAQFQPVSAKDSKTREDIIKVALVWDKVVADPELPDFALRFTVGSGWEIVEGGAKVKPAKPGSSPAFHKRSQYGALIDGAIACGAPFTEREDCGPEDADVWNNTKWLMKCEDIPGTERTDAEGKKTVLKGMVLVKCLGTADGAAPPATTSTTTTGTTAPAAPAGQSEDDTAKQIQFLADACTTAEDFFKQIVGNKIHRDYIDAKGLAMSLMDGTYWKKHSKNATATA